MSLTLTPPAAAAIRPAAPVPAATPRVAIVLLNWNGWQDTLACLSSICAAGWPGIGIFVCDNASTDGSVGHIRAGAARLGLHCLEPTPGRTPGPGWPPPGGSLGSLVLLQTGGNLGFAGGSNAGLRHALADAYDYVWLLNNDTEVEPGALPALLARMAQDPAIGLCGSTLVYAAQPDRVQNLGGGSFSPLKGRGAALGAGQPASAPIDPAGIERQMRFVSGASMLASRRFLETVGLMQEDYFLYFEEPDWAERGRPAFRLGYAPDSVVRHKVGASIGTDDFGGSSPLSTYYMTRNRLRFCWRFHKQALPFAVADLGRHALRALLRGDRARAGLILRAMLQRPMPPTAKHAG